MTRSSNSARRTTSKERAVQPVSQEKGTLTPRERARVARLDHKREVKEEADRTLVREAAQIEVARRKGLVGEWEFEDLTDLVKGLVDGTIPPIVPELLEVAPSGRFLLYEGRINGIHGHSNAGKSWTALLACKQAMEAGEHVFYFDYEDEARGLVERLLFALNVKPETVARLFHYTRPKVRFDQPSIGALLSRLQPSLVVIDAVGGSLAMEGMSYLDDMDVTLWVARVPAFIVGTGAAVLLLDHNPKDTLRGALWPIGSQRKKAAVTGAQYLQEMAVSFSKDKPGYSKIITAKDRSGASAEGSVVAHLKFDIVHVRRRGEVQAVTHIGLVDPPAKEIADAVNFKKKAKALCDALADKPLNTTDLRAAYKGSDNSDLGTVINQMVEAGFIKKEKEGKSMMHTLVAPYDGHWTPEELDLVEP
jgi:hypothetical protein